MRQLSITLASRIYRPEPSAASLVLAAIVDEATARGHKVTVLGAKPAKKFYNPPKGREKVKYFPVLRDKAGYVRGYLSYLSYDLPLFFRLLLSKKADVYLVEPPPTTGFIVRIAAGIKNAPYVYRAADIWTTAAKHVTNNFFVLKGLSLVEKFALGGASKVLVMNEVFRQELAAFKPKLETTVLGFGADTESFYYSKALINKNFIYPGTYTELHGADLLIEAFAEVAKEYPEYSLQFVGNSHLQQEYQKLAEELLVADKVEFIAAVSPKELHQLLIASPLALSTLDPTGHYSFAFTSKIFSALASGCPVLFAGSGPTTNFINAHPELYSSAVSYRKDELVQALKAAIATPLEPDKRRQIAEFIEQQASLKSVAKRAVDALERSAR